MQIIPPPLNILSNSIPNPNVEIHNIDSIPIQENILNTDNSNDLTELSSSDEYESTSEFFESEVGLEMVIARWAVRHDITHFALDDFLKSVSTFPQFIDLPKDSRTLLQTPTTTLVKEIGGGIYHHFGLRSEIEQLCKVYDTQKIPST